MERRKAISYHEKAIPLPAAEGSRGGSRECRKQDRSSMMDNWRKTAAYSAAMACAIAVGAYLRLHALSSQILLDDEWHSINEAIGKSWANLLVRFNPQDNSSPLLAVYDLVLYRTGWSEFGLRLPVVLAGLLSLIILPLLVKRLLGERVSIVFLCFLSIAPFPVFYSRYVRTYGIVMLLCFSALLLFYQWVTTGKPRYAAGFAVAGVVAIYAHLFSVVAVFTPLAVVVGFGLCTRFPARREIVVPPRSILTMACILVIPLLPLAAVVLPECSRLPWQLGRLSLDGVIVAATLVSGTANWPLNVLFFLLCIAGQTLLFRHKTLLGWLFLFTVCAYVVALLAGRPAGMQTGAILLRYMIVVLPMALLLAALAVERLLTKARQITKTPGGAPIVLAACFLACLYAFGPLPAQHVLPNNFTNHSAFQGSYARQTWQHSVANSFYPAFVAGQNQIPPFYYWLSGQTHIQVVIEYPFDICDYNNLLYFYQHFHAKRVMAGYCTDQSLFGYRTAQPTHPDGSAYAIGMLNVDNVLSRVADRGKLAFRNMIDVTDTNALSSGKADMIVLHKYIMALKIMPNGTYGSIPVYYRSVELLSLRLKKTFGEPAYEDKEIVCFGIKPPMKNGKEPGVTSGSASAG